MASSVRRPRNKPALDVVVLAREGDHALVRIQLGKDVDEYSVERIRAVDGDGFDVLRTGVGTPDDPGHCQAFLDHNGAGGDFCDCKGCLRHGRCKHLTALRQLLAGGLI